MNEQQARMARRLEATATRDGRWWVVRLPELGAVGQARTIRDIPAVAAEVAALHLGVCEEEIDAVAAAFGVTTSRIEQLAAEPSACQR